MDAEKQNLEARIGELENKLESLQGKLSSLEKRLDKLPGGRKTRPTKSVSDQPRLFNSQEVMNWLDTSFLMPRIASTSFILVLAIALRTLTDSGTINQQAGAGLGMLYGFILIALGWYSYSRDHQQSVQAPVFTLWGTIVMCSVVVETHRVFETLPTEPAYFILVLVGAATAIISRIFGVALPILAGTLGMSIGGFAIDYPNPVFPYLVLLLVIANVFTVYATRLLRMSWIRWLLLILTFFMFQIWALKLTIYLSKIAEKDLELALSGFLPAIAIIGLMYLGISYLGLSGKIQTRISRFDIALPVINVIWIVILCRYALHHGLGNPTVFGLAASAIAGGHLGLAWLLAKNKMAAPEGPTSLGLAGCILLALTLPLGIGNALVSSTIIAAVAFGGAWLAQKWKSGGIRYISYIMQIYAAGALILALEATEISKPSFLGATASALMAVIAVWHYYWCRENPPVAEMVPFKSFDKKDRGATVVLVAALISAFFTLRVGIYQGLALLGLRHYDAFSSGQSVLIIVSSIIMMFLSVKKMSRELRTIGILLMLAGACKVFLYDIINLKGMPLIISLFVFGTSAILNQILNRKWSKGKKQKTAQASSD